MTAVDACLFFNGRRLHSRSLCVTEKGMEEDVPFVRLRYVREGLAGPLSGQPSFSGPRTPRIVGYADGGALQPLAATTESRDSGQTHSELLWVGDRDSLSELPEGVAARTLDRNKSVSDGAALMDVVAQKLRDLKDLSANGRGTSFASNAITVIECIGATGGRRDHEWANFAEMEYVFRDFRNIVCIVQPSIILLGAATRIVLEEYPKGWPLSCFAANAVQEFELEGLEFSGKFCMQRPSMGLSNVSLGNRIVVKSGAVPTGAPTGLSHLVLGHDEECFFANEHCQSS